MPISFEEAAGLQARLKVPDDTQRGRDQEQLRLVDSEVASGDASPREAEAKRAKLASEDPWAEGDRFRPRSRPFDEQGFQSWYAQQAKKNNLDPNPDAPEHFYDYRAAFKAGAAPDSSGHWPSEFKREGHPRMVVDGVNTKTGEPAGKRRKISFEEARGTAAAAPDNVRNFIEAGSARAQREEDARAEEAAKPQPGRGVRNAAEIAAVADFVLSVPGMMIATGANLGSTAMGIAAGQDPKEAWGKGREIGARAAGGALNPLKNIMSLSPEFQRAYEESFTSGTMDKVMGVVEKIGDAVEKKTGGRIVKEQVQTAFDTILTGAAGYGAGRAGPKGLYEGSTKGIRVTDPRQLFPDDASHDAFMAEFKQPGTAVATTRQPRAPRSEPSIVEPGSPEWSRSDAAKAAAVGGGATALALNDEEEGGAALAVVGGIKGKGGMWHPAAVERLVSPLVKHIDEKISRESRYGVDLLAAGDEAALTKGEARTRDLYTQRGVYEKMVSRYLNRHAGTADDPLKDVRLPSGKTWEEVTDAAYGQRPGRYYLESRRIAEPEHASVRDNLVKGGQASLEQPVYGLGPEHGGLQSATREITDYLSHVGDFLRQNVDPAKLPQYDLVRAVKETARNDERVAKEMDKASAAQTAQLPIHKEYPGGMKWVELKLPEKLTEEQARGVRPAEKGEIALAYDEKPGKGYVALDAKGKPIRNSYTNENATGSTPQEAWLAGRLAEEGNQLGHCVGGYCDAVAAGESKIYSLRDEKGRSHVTVEVNPRPEKSAAQFHENMPREYQERYPLEGRDFYQTHQIEAVKNSPEFQNQSPDILQIKGKQNRAPDAKYLPFVQDFVKGGKWGEVGDLEGTGLIYGQDAWQHAPIKLERKSSSELGLDNNAFYTKGEITDAYYKQLSVTDLQKQLGVAHPGVSVHLIERPSGAITLADLKLREGVADNTGAGQAALADTVAYADANGRGMMLLAAPMGRGAGKPPMPVPKLVEIYGRHGFKESADQPFPDVARRMYRNPKGFENAEEPTIEVKPQAAEGGAGSVPGAEQGGPGRGAGEGSAGVVPGEGSGGPGRGQEGRADPRLLGGIAAAGIGGVLGAQIFQDDQMRGALWGAMVGGVLPWVVPMAKTLAAAADPALGLLSTRVKNDSVPIWHRSIEYERQIMRDTAKYMSAGAPLMRELQKAKNPALERAVTANDGPSIQAQLLATGNPELIKSWMDTRAALKDLGQQLKDAGRIKSVIDDYFPRVVKDREGLLNALGGKLREGLEAKLYAAELEAASRGGLKPAEQSVIINQWMRMHARAGSPGFAKSRVIGDIPQNLLEFYYKPWEAYGMYVQSATEDLARAKFFGQDLKTTGGREGEPLIDTSIGELVRREQEAGRINYAQAERLKKLLDARFGPERAMGPESLRTGLQTAKDLANVALLGNLVSAATQLGDSAMVAYAQGLGPTLAAVARKITGRMEITAEDLGIVNHISQEFVSPTASARFLQKTFKYSGFSLIDRMAKDLLAQAGYTRFKSLAQTHKGRAEIARKYAEAYGPDDFTQLVSDLQEGKRTDLTDSLLFHEISDMQPITKMEMPEGYLRMPNGRVVYMLKTFMLKQADVVRRDAYNEMRQGNYGRAARNLTRFALALGISGVTTTVIKDWLQNKEQKDIEMVDLVDNVFKTFGWSNYVIDKAKSGHPVEALLGIAAPPYKIMDDLIRADPKLIRYIPGVGPQAYSLLDKEELAREKRDRARDNRDEDALEKRRDERRRQRGY